MSYGLARYVAEYMVRILRPVDLGTTRIERGVDGLHIVTCAGFACVVTDRDGLAGTHPLDVILPQLCPHGL